MFVTNKSKDFYAVEDFYYLCSISPSFLIGQIDKFDFLLQHTNLLRCEWAENQL